MFFRKKKKDIDSKFKIDEFVAFHMNNDLKHGVIKDVKIINSHTYYDINVGGEAAWIAKGVEEDKIVKLKKQKKYQH